MTANPKGVAGGKRTRQFSIESAETAVAPRIRLPTVEDRYPTDNDIYTVQDGKVFIAEHVAPFVKKMLQYAPIPDTGHLRRQTSFANDDRSLISMDASIELIPASQMELDLEVIESKALREDEIMQSWDSIVSSGMTDMIDEEDIDEGETDVESLCQALMEEGVVASYIKHTYEISRHRSPRVNIAIGYSLNGGEFPIFDQEVERSSQQELLGDNLGELETIRDMACQMQFEIDQFQYNRLRYALGVLGISTARQLPKA